MTLRWVSRNRAITSWNRIITWAAPSGTGCVPLAEGVGRAGVVSVVFISARGVTGTAGVGITRGETGCCGAGVAVLGERGASAPCWLAWPTGAGVATGG